MFSNHIGFKISGYFLTAITTVVSCSTCWNLTPCSWSPISDMLASMLGQPCFRRVLKNFLCSCSFVFFWKLSLLPRLLLHVSLVGIFQPFSWIPLSEMLVTMFGQPCVRRVALKTLAASHTVGLSSHVRRFQEGSYAVNERQQGNTGRDTYYLCLIYCFRIPSQLFMTSLSRNM